MFNIKAFVQNLFKVNRKARKYAKKVLKGEIEMEMLEKVNLETDLWKEYSTDQEKESQSQMNL